MTTRRKNDLADKEVQFYKEVGDGAETDDSFDVLEEESNQSGSKPAADTVARSGHLVRPAYYSLTSDRTDGCRVALPGWMTARSLGRAMQTINIERLVLIQSEQQLFISWPAKLHHSGHNPDPRAPPAYKSVLFRKQLEGLMAAMQPGRSFDDSDRLKMTLEEIQVMHRKLDTCLIRLNQVKKDFQNIQSETSSASRGRSPDPRRSSRTRSPSARARRARSSSGHRSSPVRRRSLSPPLAYSRPRPCGPARRWLSRSPDRFRPVRRRSRSPSPLFSPDRTTASFMGPNVCTAVDRYGRYQYKR